MDKILIFACNENKIDLSIQFDRERLFDVHLISLKLMDKLDIIQDFEFNPEKITDYPTNKKKWLEENGQKSTLELEDEIISFESKYEIRSSNQLLSYNYGRSILPSVNYKNALLTIRFEQEFCLQQLLRIKPKFVLGELSRSYYLIMFDLCKYLKITFLHPIEFRSTYFGEPLYTLTDDLGKMPLLEKQFLSIQKDGASKAAAEFGQTIAMRMANPKRYNSKNLTNFEGGNRLFIKKIKYRIRRLPNLIQGLKVDQKHYPEKLLTKNFIWSILDRFVLRKLFTKYKILFNSKYLDSNPNLEEKYIYFPLHYYPETTSSVWASKYVNYYDQEFHLIQLLSKSLPSGYKLYVKEHLPMIRTRKKDFYKKVKSFYNVTLIHPRADSLTILKKSSAAISIVGTVGVEALINKVPIITFSGAYYGFLNSVYKLYLDKNISAQLNEILTGETEADEMEIFNFFCAFYQASCPFSLNTEKRKSEFEIFYSKESVHSIAKYIAEYQDFETK